MKRPFGVWILSSLLLFLSAGAFYGGIAFILFPNGSILKMDPGWLHNSPFSSYLVPGILLLILNGIIPLIAFIGLFSKYNNRFLKILNIYPEKQTGWAFSLYSGITAVCWIIVQQLMTGYFILQPVISATGISIIIVTLLPGVSKFYSKTNSHARI